MAELGVKQAAIAVPAHDKKIEPVLDGVSTERVGDVTAFCRVQIDPDRGVPGDLFPGSLENGFQPARLSRLSRPLVLRSF